VAAYNKNFVILACTVLIQIKSVTNGRTARRTNTSMMAKTRETLHAVARNIQYRP